MTDPPPPLENNPDPAPTKQCRFCVSEIPAAAAKCPSCQEWQSPKPSDQDQRELERRRLVEAVRDTVEKTLIRRYSWLGVVIAALTGGLGTLLVNNALSDARTELSLAERLRERADAAIDSLLEAERTLADLSRRASLAESVMQSVTLTAENLGSRLVRETTQGFALTRMVNAKVDSLAAVITDLAEQKDEIEQRLSTVRASLPDIDSLSERAGTVAELGQYPVRISDGYRGDADALSSDLRARGYTVQWHELAGRRPTGEYSAILIGVGVPVDVVKTLLAATARHGAVTEVRLYSTNFGSASLAKNIMVGGLSQREWSPEDFDRLVNNAWTSLKDMHDYIRSFSEK